MDAVTQALIAALTTLLSAVQSDLALAEATGTAAAGTDEAALLAIQAHAESAIALLTAEAAGTRTVTVRASVFGAESVFVLAQRELNDPLRYGDVLDANGLTTLVLTVGQRLTLPAA